MAKNKKGFDVSSMMAMGAGAIALAASTYYLFGPAGKIHRKKAAGWMLKMKGEIIEKIEEAGEMSEAAYHSIVDSALASQVAAGKISPEELTAYAAGLKSQWKNILKTLKPAKKSKKKSASAAKKSSSKKPTGKKKPTKRK